MEENLINNFEEEFKLYIDLLRSLKDCEKGELNDLYIQEESLRESIIKNLKLLKRDFF